MNPVEEARKLLEPCNELGDPDSNLAVSAAAYALLALVEQQKRTADAVERIANALDEMTITFREGDRHLQIIVRER